jgi:hypothetical protein
MGGIRTMLSERVESLLPRTTAAAACLPPSSWEDFRFYGNPYCSYSERTCHISCHGGTTCGPWTFYPCLIVG